MAGMMCAGLMVAILFCVCCVYGEIRLEKDSTIYLPYNYVADNKVPVFGVDKKAIKQFVFDKTSKLIYAVGKSIIHVIDAQNPSNASYLHRKLMPDAKISDVAISDNHVFVTYERNNTAGNGGLLIFYLYKKETDVLQIVQDLPIEGSPESILVSSTGTVIVALENEAIEANGQVTDPPGAVAIFTFPDGYSAQPVVTVLDFTKFDSRYDQLSPSNVRWIYRANGNKFSNDVEPESLTFNADHTKVYVGLQENNAIAEIDLLTKNITGVYGLGYKQWGKLDPSDRDGGININNWNPIRAFYQPDEIRFVTWRGQNYILTANEGGSKEYDSVNFDEEKRGYNISEAELSPSLSPELKAALQNETLLGRLEFSGIDGKDENGLFTSLYTYGGRSYSIWTLPKPDSTTQGMNLVYDSGSNIEEKIAAERPDLFNNRLRRPNNLVSKERDSRSDDRGPEPESVVFGEIDNLYVIVVGIERPGLLYISSVENDISNPRFESLYSEGIPLNSGNQTWNDLYESRQLFGIDPECIQFIKKGELYPNNAALLIAGTDSSTLTIAKFVNAGSTGSGGATP